MGTVFAGDASASLSCIDYAKNASRASATHFSQNTARNRRYLRKLAGYTDRKIGSSDRVSG